MLIDDLREQLKTLEPDISIIHTFWKNSNNQTRIDELEAKSNDPEAWKDPKQADILKELQALKNIQEQYQQVTQTFVDTKEMLELFQDDEAEIQKLATEIKTLGGQIRSFKMRVLS